MVKLYPNSTGIFIKIFSSDRGYYSQFKNFSKKYVLIKNMSINNTHHQLQCYRIRSTSGNDSSSSKKKKKNYIKSKQNTCLTALHWSGEVARPAMEVAKMLFQARQTPPLGSPSPSPHSFHNLRVSPGNQSQNC